MKNFTYLFRKVLSIIPIFLIFCSTALGQQVPRGLTASNNVFIGFYEYKPTDYSANPNEKYPMIIFLHGIGERGNGTSELPMVLGQGIPKYINAGHPMRFFWNGKWETFLVLSPQLSRNYGDWQNFYVDEMLNYAKNNLRVDTNRIYLTGLSLGGGGVWRYASASVNNAKKFAAIAPVCGTCALSNACNLASANLPVWAFHALDDGIVGAGCTTSSIQGINNCNPAVKPLMTLYSNGGHFIWDRSFDTVYNWHNPNLYEWFLGQNKSLPINVGPTANAGPNITITLPTTTATLNASASSDPDGNIVRYRWRKLSGPNVGTIQSPNSVSSNITALTTAGTYTYELMVADNRAAYALDTVVVTVNPGLPGVNIAPFAVAGADQTITVSNVNLDSWGSYDVDGSIVAYLWTKISGPAQYNMPYNMYGSCGIDGLVSGVYQFELRVTDNQGAYGRDTVQVTVNLPGPPPVNQAPNANAGADITISLPANSTTLNGSGSSDPDGTISTYSWSWISGPAQYNIASPSSATTGLNNLVQGTYSFRLTVTDNAGATDSDTVQVTVNAAPPPTNIAPVANAGTDIVITLPTNTTTLNGNASSDADGSIVSYSWSRISGPAQFTLANANAAATGLSNLVQGTYAFRLVVTDNNSSTDDDTVIVTVNGAPPPTNIAPIAKAGADISLTLPTNNTTLNGFDSYDPDGVIASFAWSRVSGPTQFTLANANAGSTALSNLAQGTYLFQLHVTDNNGASAYDTVSIIVSNAPPPPNQAPIANAGSDITITLPTNSTTLNGSASSDPDGTIVSYNWVKIAGPAQFTIANANAASTTINNLTQGVYSFRLVVTDNNGGIDSDTLIVTVNPAPNQAPVANAGTNITITLPTNSTGLSGSASSDPDGTIAAYAWTQVSGPNSATIAGANSVSPTVSNLVQGTYSFRLLVTDNNGATDADTVQVIVNPAPPPPNQAPNANAGQDIVITLPASNTTLNGGASSDPDGTIVSFNWSKIAGPAQFSIANPNASSTALSNLVQGTYSFRLVVTDNNGATDSDTVNVVVNAAAPAPNQAPVANAGTDISITLPVNNTNLNGTASSDPDGVIASYSWTRISGPTQFTIANANAATTALSNLVEGTYSFRLLVTDNNGASASDTVNVVVNAPAPVPNQAPIANAGTDFAVTMPNPAVSLNGSASTDPDGTIASYSWSKVSGPGAITIVNSNTAFPNVVGVQAGVYVFELTVTDNRGASATDQVTVTVNAGSNQLPVANAGRDTTITVPASSSVLNGTLSYDPDGAVVSYNWRQVSGPSLSAILTSSNAITPVGNLITGQYLFELTVTDDKGATNKDSVSVLVVNNFNYREELTLYPNPASSIMNIRCISDSIGLTRMVIYDMSGTIVRTSVFTKAQYIYEVQTNVNGLKAGAYYLEILINGRKKMIAKFIKQ